jgi:predicted RND superfamily exporter protein
LLGPLTEVSQIVPILLVGLGVDYGIHLTSRYRDEVGAGAGVDSGCDARSAPSASRSCSPRSRPRSAS